MCVSIDDALIDHDAEGITPAKVVTTFVTVSSMVVVVVVGSGVAVAVTVWVMVVGSVASNVLV